MARAIRDDGRVIVDRLAVANTFWTRLKGLMGNDSLQPDEGLLIQGEGGGGIHCFFMKIPIDLVYLDQQGQIVHLTRQMRPWTVARPILRARDVIECYPGTIARHGLMLGEVIQIEES